VRHLRRTVPLNEVPGTVDRLLTTALEAAEAAADVQRRAAASGGPSPAEVAEKGRADYVSRTDLEAQEAALAVIHANHPDHSVLAEESDESVEERLAQWDGGPLWIVDPLDGTTNFLHTHPFHCASVGVAVEGRPIAGAVVSGSSGDRWWAADGQGAFKNGQRIRVSDRRYFRDALVGTGFPFKRLEMLPGYLQQLDRVLRSSAGVRRAGSAALDFCFLAQGSLDAFWEATLMPWDFAAGIVLVQEAGGVLCGEDGSELRIVPGPVRGANSLEMLEELQAMLRG
jgi:myo-inositol-1(or 4)-monophosphatase